jgi:hypothetical protein
MPGERPTEDMLGSVRRLSLIIRESKLSTYRLNSFTYARISKSLCWRRRRDELTERNQTDGPFITFNDSNGVYIKPSNQSLFPVSLSIFTLQSFQVTPLCQPSCQHGRPHPFDHHASCGYFAGCSNASSTTNEFSTHTDVHSKWIPPTPRCDP